MTFTIGQNILPKPPLPDPYAELKAAHAAGKVIQFFDPISDSWLDAAEPSWTLRNDDYRIKPEPDEDGWIPHDGGACPVDGETRVDVKLENGRVFTDLARNRTWEYDDFWIRITHYRLAPAPKFIPWTRETCPPLPFEVRHNEHRNRHTVVAALEHYVKLGGHSDGPNYKRLMKEYTLPNGSPCGTEVKL